MKDLHDSSEDGGGSGYNLEVKQMGLLHGLSLGNEENEESRMSHQDFGLSNKGMVKVLLNEGTGLW